MKNKLKKIRINSTLIYLVILLLGLLLFPMSKTFSAGTGDLIVSASFPPASVAPSSVTFNIIDSISGNPYITPPYPYSLTNLSTPPWTMTISNIPVGLYYVIFDPISGYTTPEPDAITTNDGWENNYPRRDDPLNQQGRRINIIAGDNTMSVTYRKISELKQLGHTTAETLLYDSGGAPYKVREWDLLRGVASISVDGVNWQSSVAEILSVGTMAQATIVKDGPHYVFADGSAEYKLQFSATNTKAIDGTYGATITDTITVGGGQASMVTVESATVTSVSLSSNCSLVPIPLTWSADTSIAGKITFNNIDASKDCIYEALVKLKFNEAIAPNTIVQDTAEMKLDEGPVASADFTTLVVGSFTQETVGGDIYAKGELDFGQLPTGKYGGKYVLGADGNLQTTSASESGWTLDQYGIRSGSTSDFSPDECSVSGSACKAMNDNIVKLKKGAGAISNSYIPNDLNPSKIPEGGAFYFNGDSYGNLTIGSVGGTVDLQGKGTIIVENGDLRINSNMLYKDETNNSKDILGIIVKNGNVIIDPSVAKIDAIFYIYSERSAGQKGQFIVSPNMSSTPDIQLKIKGAVIASGYSFFDVPTGAWVRKWAFVLGRKYVGDSSLINQAIIDGKPIAYIESLFEPAELFLYDSRIIVMPPPGFGGKIAGSL